MLADELLKRVAEASKDYRYLLDRGYNYKVALRVVQERYQLEKLEVDVLFRAVHSRNHDEHVKRALAEGERTISRGGAVIYVDFFNVANTLLELNSGGLVSLGTDGIFRDHSKVLKRSRKGESDYSRVCSSLDFPTKDALVVLVGEKDKPFSGRILRRCADELKARGYSAEGVLEAMVDSFIIRSLQGRDSAVVATSDSVVLRRISRCFELVRHVMEREAAKSGYKVRWNNIIDVESVVYEVD